MAPSPRPRYMTSGPSLAFSGREFAFRVRPFFAMTTSWFAPPVRDTLDDTAVAHSLQSGEPTMTSPASRYRPNRTPCRRTRREFLWEVGGGFAGLALIDLLSRDGFFAGPAAAQTPAPPRPAARARARHAVFLFMNGGPSHVDTFDPKPALTR